MPAIDASIVSLATDTSFEDGSVSHYMTVKLPNEVFIRAVITPEAARELQKLLAPVRPAPVQTQTLVFEGGAMHRAGEEPSAVAQWTSGHAATERPAPTPPFFGTQVDPDEGPTQQNEDEEDFESSGFNPLDDGAQAL